MPTYAYACTACDHRFDVQQAFTDDALTECPSCHGRLRKVFGAVGVVFKGSGFYRTDSRGKQTSAEPASTGSGSSGGSSGGTGGSSGTSSSTTTGGSSTGSSTSSSSSGSGASSTGGSSSGTAASS